MHVCTCTVFVFLYLCVCEKLSRRASSGKDRDLTHYDTLVENYSQQAAEELSTGAFSTNDRDDYGTQMCSYSLRLSFSVSGYISDESG